MFYLGDGPIGAFTFTLIENLKNILDGQTLESFPDVFAIVNEAVDELGEQGSTANEMDVERNRLEAFCFERINIAHRYFMNHFIRTREDGPTRIGDNDLGHLHLIFEGFALTDPGYIRQKLADHGNNTQELIPYIRSRLQHLVDNNRISATMFQCLMSNIGPYIGIAREFTYGHVKFHEKLSKFIVFWRQQLHVLPSWIEFVKIAILHHPNSCGSERLFSLLKYVLTSEKEECLDDYICAAVYTSYRMRRDEERIR